MSKEKITSDIEGLTTAVVTAYMKYINEHRGMGNVRVLTASAFYLAVIVDALTFDEGDPSQEEVMTLIVDTAMTMLKDPRIIRQYMGAILKSVLEESH
jgi:uncharacterized membrane protein